MAGNGEKKIKRSVFNVSVPGEPERTGRYTFSPAAQKQRELAAKGHTYPVAKTEEELAENASRIEHIIRVQEIASHADRKDLLSLKSCFIEFLKLCQEDGSPIGNIAVYAALGFTNQEFDQWSKADIPERKEFVRFIKSTCAMFREGLVTEGKLHPVVGIFWQRNFDGLRNDTEQVQSLKDADETSAQSNNYRKRYANLIGAEGDDK